MDELESNDGSELIFKSNNDASKRKDALIKKGEQYLKDNLKSRAEELGIELPKEQSQEIDDREAEKDGNEIGE